MARTDSKLRQSAYSANAPEIAIVHSYHSGSGSSNYAYNGFFDNRYYTSDRFIKLDNNFRRPDGKALKGYGLEIELGCNTISSTTVLAEILDKVVFAHFPEHLFKMQSDCSLRGSSTAECITQVMTREFIRNHYPEFKLMYDHYFRTLGIESNTSCGMHCNISNAVFGAAEKTQADAIRKLYYIVNHHYDQMCIMLHRDRDATLYCGRMTAEKEACRTMDLTGHISSHGVSFNLGHYTEGRIELRLVGNQISYACFRNTMETIFHLCSAVKDLSWSDCDDFARIWYGCNQHVFDRLTMVRGMDAADLQRVRSTVVPVDFR